MCSKNPTPQLLTTPPPRPPLVQRHAIVEECSLNTSSLDNIALRMERSFAWRLSKPSSSGRKSFPAKEAEDKAALYCRLLKNAGYSYKQLLKIYLEAKKEDSSLMAMKQRLFKAMWGVSMTKDEAEISRATDLLVWFFDSARGASLKELTRE